VLSTRSTAEEWYRSASATIFAVDPANIPGAGGRDDFIPGMFDRFTRDIQNPEAAVAAYEAHNQQVREAIPPPRLVEWQPVDGWEPICQALALPVPEEPFPHVNTREMFQQRLREPTVQQSPA